MKLQEGVISQQKNEALAHGSGGTQNTYKYLLAHMETFFGRMMKTYRTSSWDMRLPCCTGYPEVKDVTIGLEVSF
jgi:hypothetical protein